MTERWPAVILVLVLSASASAHEGRAGYFELREEQPGLAIVAWRLAFSVDEMRAVLPWGCSSEPIAERVLTLHCPHPLAGQTLNFAPLGDGRGETLVHVVLADGTEQSAVLGPTEARYVLPTRATTIEVLRDYVFLGVTHILAGIDHILFVLGLLLLTRGLRQRLWTVTMFTLAHSVTLGATALGLLHLNTAAAEACIALSLVLVALEVCSAFDSHSAEAAELPTPTPPDPLAPGWGEGGQIPPKRKWSKQTIVIALAFGLVHGLGFATALADTGLPSHAIPLALLSFNLGVELGQLGIVFAALALARVALRLARPHDQRLTTAARFGVGYFVGVAGCFWLFSRLALLGRMT